MAWKRHSDEDALKILREINVHLHDGLDVVSACRRAECRHSLRFVPRSALRDEVSFRCGCTQVRFGEPFDKQAF